MRNRLSAALALSTISFFLAASGAAAAARPVWLVAAGKADITPDLAHETVWLAGFGADGRKPTGIQSHLYARALLVSDGRKTVALVAVDTIGLYRRDVMDMRRAAGWTGPDRYLFVSATHSHSTPDSLGLWGRFPGVSGVNEQYRHDVITAVADLVNRLDKKLAPARFYAAETDVNPRGLCRDSRDPVVIDPELDVLQFRSLARPSKTIGTLVRWSCHPEVMWDDNDEVSADYPGVLCRTVEKKTGGACVFQSGVIGGLLTPDVDRKGGPPQEIKEMNRVGTAVADDALRIIGKAQSIAPASVSFSSRTLVIPVENSRYLLLLPHLTYGHRVFDKNGKPLSKWMTYWIPLKQLLFFPIPKPQEPRVKTEIALVKLGPVKILGVPGELFPELAIGGYHGRYRFGHPLVKPGNPNPPDLAKAPKGPYLRQELHARVGIIVGLANDELGYIMPNYDFKISRTRLMLPRLPGDHYEETNSIGPSVTGILLNAYKKMLAR
ncbi:MAG: neutral/alkaline non-lysosomal ceramidase N-terminal domain-containing protein [Elusimicrobia bacterium]|nr:neutral/alkaline non-lysosomal ceramidase N-terminal domain-containing protein [Elusimicrobiota bacterium]MDE2313218.1 neutral/alkaline non-lysosomal ceramidase N-terminal domain-containing protein [Elusimicrobiota bacterium]